MNLLGFEAQLREEIRTQKIKRSFLFPVLPIWYMSRLAACLANGQMRGQRGKPGFEEHTLAGNEKSAKTTGWQRGVREQLCSACCCHGVGG